MRSILTMLWVLCFVTAAIPATAQEAPAECHPVSPTVPVVVTHNGGTNMKGTLLCMSATEFLMIHEGRATVGRLSDVRRIQTPPDPVWDGAVKGAAIPLIAWAVFCRGCSAEPMLKSVLAYSLVGLTFDAAQANRRILYAGSRSAAIGWRVRF